jgi:hypothetical protein
LFYEEKIITMKASNTEGGCCGMKRWSFREDYLVGKFCEDHKYMFIEGELLDELIEMLADAGFSFRSRNAVMKRARYYLPLTFGQDEYVKHIPKQVRELYRVLTSEEYNSDHREKLAAYITNKNQHTILDDAQDAVFGSATDLTRMVHTAKGPRFVDVLENLIGESCIRPKTKIYSDVGMKQDTFAAIRRGKYSTISRENVFRICFGLRLSYDSATMLMRSCGIIFREELVLDTVVEYHLKKGPTKREGEFFKYDCELIDTDLMDSGVETLFAEW